ncbi:MAG: hypothetical protein ISS73_06395 [Pirellulales bacterium]|nr:hypothetical protein [Pirellulales bacterium]
MNTYRIYEQLKESLGDPAAKALAETLGGMVDELRDTVTKDDFRTLQDSMTANSGRLERSLEKLAEAQGQTAANVGRLDATMEKLAEAQSRTEANVGRLDAAMEKLAEAQGQTAANVGRLDAAMEKLAEAQGRTELKVNELAEAQSRTEANVGRLDAAMEKLAEAQGQTAANVGRLDAAMERLTDAQADMASALQRLTIRTDDAAGRSFELQFRERLTAYLGRFLRRGKVVPNDQLLGEIEPRLTPREVDDVLRADVIASGSVEGKTTYLVVEVSWTGDTEDIVRADERATLLRRAGLAAIPLVACNVISPESAAMAKLRQVRVWCNGSLLESAA